MQETLISCLNINLSFGNYNVLKNVSLSVKNKEIVTIIGPNGSGKTSLLKILCGLQEKRSGDIEVREGITIGYMPQRLVIERVLPLTVHRFLRLNKKKLRNRKEINRIAKELGITALMDNQIHDISGGEMQRVMLARALLLDPDLLVMDEPAQGLDIHGQGEFYRLINKIRDERDCGILMVSHDLHMVMAATDRVICINNHICCEGTPEDVNKNPGYLELFGKDEAKNIAVYTHHHDHTHDIGEEK